MFRLRAVFTPPIVAVGFGELRPEAIARATMHADEVAGVGGDFSKATDGAIFAVIGAFAGFVVGGFFGRPIVGALAGGIGLGAVVYVRDVVTG